MKRKHFIKTGIIGLGVLSLHTPQCLFSFDTIGDRADDKDLAYLLSSGIDAADLPVPDDMRVPFNWGHFGLHQNIATINFKPVKRFARMPALFRISVAIDVREQKMVEVLLAKSNRLLGVLDIRYSPVFQPFQLALTASDVEDVFNEGIVLKQVKGDKPIWFLQAGETTETSNKALMPHLLFDAKKKKPLDAFYGNLLSLNVIQTFGWMEGCVLDGLFDMNIRFPRKNIGKVIQSHLQLFFDKQNNLSYEGPYSRPYSNKFYGIEALLPFGVIAQMYPEHPLLPAVAEYCISKADNTGLVQDNHITTEGCYTIAYPLAAIAVALKQPQLASLAMNQLLLRKDLLLKDNNIYQRLDENKQLHFANWARGVSWYLLGMIRTLSIFGQHKSLFPGIEKELENTKIEFIRAANWALRFQDVSGLWFCFLDKPATGIDTSGSAGIAAALAIGTAMGYLPPAFKQSSKSTFSALLKNLTPDGFLTGASQANKGGIELQQNGYRVISQYASGLMAQLIAATGAGI